MVAAASYAQFHIYTCVDLPELLQSQLQESKQTKSRLGWKKMIMVPATDWINKQWPCCVLYVLTFKGATYPGKCTS